MTTHVLALGGGGFSMSDGHGATALDRHALALSGSDRPTVCFVPTASGDATPYIERFEAAYAPLDCETRVLRLVADGAQSVARTLEGVDVLMVGGGSTVNLVALWELHGVTRELRRLAAERDLVLAGLSAGANCWFEGCTTDSFGPVVVPWRGGTGFVEGSFCPHADGEDRVGDYAAAVASGALPAGWAADDGAAVHVVDGVVRAHLAERPGAVTYRVEPDGQGGATVVAQQVTLV
ncbi:Type 1 glutamine amidotransferase-like domain-containing protein [Sanguibacter sp. A247]|uniref:Type 1 glutamine amidotransferase-like domain-containing protein n=1 Tax=unclassified Sanguibacter TaxID=2645534 RepID=UPI003FD87503